MRSVTPQCVSRFPTREWSGTMGSAKAPSLHLEAFADPPISHERDREASPIMMDQPQTVRTTPRRKAS